MAVKVTFNKSLAIAKIQGAKDAALTIAGIQALKDSNQYVPRDQNTLRDSSITNSDRAAQNGVFKIRWDEPYARYLFHGEVMHGNPTNRTYGPEKLKFTEALARMEWAKYAKEKHGNEWKQVYQKALQRGLMN